jgi:hypothetical protein
MKFSYPEKKRDFELTEESMNPEVMKDYTNIHITIKALCNFLLIQLPIISFWVNKKENIFVKIALM